MFPSGFRKHHRMGYLYVLILFTAFNSYDHQMAFEILGLWFGFSASIRAVLYLFRYQHIYNSSFLVYFFVWNFRYDLWRKSP